MSIAYCACNKHLIIIIIIIIIMLLIITTPKNKLPAFPATAGKKPLVSSISSQVLKKGSFSSQSGHPGHAVVKGLNINILNIQCIAKNFRRRFYCFWLAILLYEINL